MGIRTQKSNRLLREIVDRFLQSPLRTCKNRLHPCYFCDVRILKGETYYRWSDWFAHDVCVRRADGNRVVENVRFESEPEAP